MKLADEKEKVSRLWFNVLNHMEYARGCAHAPARSRGACTPPTLVSEGDGLCKVYWLASWKQCILLRPVWRLCSSCSRLGTIIYILLDWPSRDFLYWCRPHSWTSLKGIFNELFAKKGHFCDLIAKKGASEVFYQKRELKLWWAPSCWQVKRGLLTSQRVSSTTSRCTLGGTGGSPTFDM